MADIATPSAATMSTIDAGPEPSQKAQKTKPEKPDEQTYKESLGKAQKEHAAAQERVVSLSSPKVSAHHRNLIGSTIYRMPSRPRSISLNLKIRTLPLGKGSRSSKRNYNIYDRHNLASSRLAVGYKRRL